MHGLYFMSSIVEWDTGADRAGLFIGCFLRADNNTGTIGTEVCAPPLLLDDIATLFTPEGVEHGKSDIATEALSSDIRVPPSILLSTRRSVWGNLERGSSRGYATARKWHLIAPTTRGIPPGVRTSKASAVLGATRVAPPARAVGFWGSAREQAAVGGQSPSEPIRAISQAIRANQSH